ncbi:MAG: hemerythrin domain-containing protein [Acidimicrobiales bacterium]
MNPSPQPPPSGTGFEPGASLTAMADELEATHHAYLRAVLPELHNRAVMVADTHAAHHPELAPLAALIRELRAELEPHLAKEEQVLFPFARLLDGAEAMPRFNCGSIRNPIGAMLADHDRTDELLARLRAATAGFTAHADAPVGVHHLYRDLAELEADTLAHIHKENHGLFPAAMAAERALLERQAASAGPDQGGDPACWAHRFGPFDHEPEP